MSTRSHIELPSGRLINANDIIYVSNIYEHENSHRFKVIWANQSIMYFDYPEKIDANTDRKHIKTYLLKEVQEEKSEMICD